MAADLNIHIYEGLTEDDLRAFFRNTFGSKYFDPINVGDPRHKQWEEALEKIHKTPSVWVGSVSWLKAGLSFEGGERYIPEVVEQIHSLVGEELPVVDDTFIAKVREIYEKAPAESRAPGYDTKTGAEVIAFLEEHKGKRCFTVSW